MKVLVTGADGFVGRYLVRRLLAEGHEVSGAVRPGSAAADDWLTDTERRAVRWTPLELRDAASTDALLVWPADAVVHLAAVASGSEARRDPGGAWETNAAGTARIAEAAARARAEGRADPVLLVVSTGEVYGATARPGRALREDDPLAPQSPYAASKVGGEVAALEVWRRTGLRTIIARAFQHTGPGQSDVYVIPALARRLVLAQREGAGRVVVGSLEAVRDISDVRDVVAAYVGLLSHGAAGEAYNVARGEGITLADAFGRLAAMLGSAARPERDPALVRPADIPWLVGDSSKLRSATGWAPSLSIDQTLRDVLDAQAH